MTFKAPSCWRPASLLGWCNGTAAPRRKSSAIAWVPDQGTDRLS